MTKEELKLRARSNADFISKITIVEEECDETLFWLELIKESNLYKSKLVMDLIKEADELTAIFTASGKTAKLNNPQSAIRNPQSPIRNPQSEIRNPQSEIRNHKYS